MKTKAKKVKIEKLYTKSKLKAGDTVMIIAGGSGDKRPNKGKTGTIREFVGKKGDRAVIDGQNLFTKHEKQKSPEEPGGKIQKEGSIHISNLMYYVDKIKKPVRLKSKLLDDGTKVRGYLDPKKKEFIQV